MFYTYCITNNKNNKKYFGFTNNYKRRWMEHKLGHDLKKGHRSPIQHAIKRHGVNNFTFEIVGFFHVKEEALSFEIECIANHKTNIRRYGSEFGYNLSDGGEVGVVHSRDRKLTDEHKKNISIANSGKKKTEEEKHRMSERSLRLGIIPPSRKGHTHTDKARKAIALAMSNRIVSEETRSKLAIVNMGTNNPRHGKFKLSTEQMIEIQNSDLSSRKLAKIYGVGKTTINVIRKRALDA